jgi:hypothetical protein
MAESERIAIKGFWHIMLKNNCIDIIKCQLKCIVDSGLYDRLEVIYVGCVGDKRLLDELKLVLIKYKKINIYSFNSEVKLYEFHTLKILHDISKKSEFYGFYIHTKGVNYPGNEGGKYWLDYMNYYNLTCWKDSVTNLDIGYETCGVKLLSARKDPAYQMHYSGNFFWFKSNYAKYLINIDELDWNNRGEAEMWICSNNPIAATVCQEFIDYNSKGEFKPFKIKNNI